MVKMRILLNADYDVSATEIPPSSQGVLGKCLEGQSAKKACIKIGRSSVQDLKIINLANLEAALSLKKSVRAERSTTISKVLTRSAK